MPTIPLPQGITGLEDFPKLKEYYMNLIRIEEGLVRFPGTELLLTGEGVSRGTTTWYVDNLPYIVSGSRLLQIQEDLTSVDLGAIAGGADCEFSLGQIHLVIVVKGGAIYQYDTSLGLVQLDFEPAVAVDFIDGRHVFIPANGDPAYYSSLESLGSELTVEGFFDAEELPDINKTVINVQNQLHIGGEQSFQIFRTNVDPDFVFVPRQGSRVDVGFVSALVRVRTTFAFIGRRRDEGYKIYVMTNGDAQPISNSTIDEILNEELNRLQVESAGVDSFEWKGNDILVFTVGVYTWSYCFETNSWSYVNSQINSALTGVWEGKGIVNAFGRYIVGNRFNSNIGALTAITTEYGQDVQWEIQTYVRGERETYFGVSNIQLDVLNGQKLTEERIGLKISRDGELWPMDWYYRPFSTTGLYQNQIKWMPPGGMGNYENYMGIRIRSTADVRIGMESLQWR